MNLNCATTGMKNMIGDLIISCSDLSGGQHKGVVNTKQGNLATCTISFN